MPEIRVRTAGGRVERFPIERDQISIGRSRDNDILLHDISLSRRHAEIRRRGDEFFLRDLGSVNGTRVNGERISTERRIHPGDVIKISKYVLTLCEAEDPAEEEPAYPAGVQAFPARDLGASATLVAVGVEDMERQSRTLDILSRAASAVVSHRPLDELFALMLDELLEVTPADRVALVLMEGDPPWPRVKASRARAGPAIETVSGAIVRRVVGDRASLLIPKVLEDAGFATRESLVGQGIRSAMAAPLLLPNVGDAEEAVIGLLYLDRFQELPGFGEHDVRLLTALASLAATRIQSVRLLATSQDKRRMDAELEKAAQVQTSLLPQDMPALPGYEVAGEIRSGSTVGADYYDVDVVGGDLVFALGDVAGRGTGAALLMSLLRAAVRTNWTDGSPGTVMPRINYNLLRSVPANRYATLFLGRLALESGRLRYVNAGHCPPILLRRTGEAVTLAEGGTVLGTFEDIRFEEGVVEVEPGDLLALFSDGVADAMGNADALGEGSLAAVLRNERERPAAAILAALLGALTGHVGSGPVYDDWTLMVVKRL